MSNKAATWANTTLVPSAFQILRLSRDEDTREELVALIGNLRRTPRSIRVEQTVHRLKPARETNEFEFNLNNSELVPSGIFLQHLKNSYLDGSS